MGRGRTLDKIHLSGCVDAGGPDGMENLKAIFALQFRPAASVVGQSDGRVDLIWDSEKAVRPKSTMRQIGSVPKCPEMPKTPRNEETPNGQSKSYGSTRL
jgi:hypothetical protein